VLASGLAALNVANPAAPTLTGTNALGSVAYDAAIVGQYVYVADEVGIALVPAGIAPAIDADNITLSLSGTMVSVIGGPQSITGNMPITLEVANGNTGASISGVQVQADGSFAALLPGAASHRITVKATDSFTRVNGPLVIGTVPFGTQSKAVVITQAMADAGFQARNVSSHGNHAVVASYPPSNSDKLVLFDVTNRANPTYVRTVPSGASTLFDVKV
jgi:hypothetical protein